MNSKTVVFHTLIFVSSMVESRSVLLLSWIFATPSIAAMATLSHAALIPTASPRFGAASRGSSRRVDSSFRLSGKCSLNPHQGTLTSTNLVCRVGTTQIEEFDIFFYALSHSLICHFLFFFSHLFLVFGVANSAWHCRSKSPLAVHSMDLLNFFMTRTGCP